MQHFEIHILPEAKSFLQDLPFVLIQEGYNSTYEVAEKIVDDILDFILQLPSVPHYKIPDSVAYHFSRYGNNLQYTFFKRKSSRKTTWYIFFTVKGNKILVKHISNNWTEGQYIR